MGTRISVLLALIALLVPQFAIADDYGPHAAVARIRSEAARLLAARVRASGVDPKAIAVSDVVVSGNQALLSWDSGKQHGVMGLVLSADRWWDALDVTRPDPSGCWYIERSYPLAADMPYPAPYLPSDFEPPPDSSTLAGLGMSRDIVAQASSRNADVRSSNAAIAAANEKGRLVKPYWCDAATYSVSPPVQIEPAGGKIAPVFRSLTSGYAITIGYAKNDAAADAKLARLFLRAPTAAEFAAVSPPAPGWGGPDAVCFFDVDLAGSKAVSFEAGTTIDVWFPFVLDDQMKYNLNFFSNGKPSGLIFGKVYDNTLHFVLPQITIAPDKGFVAEIDGD